MKLNHSFTCLCSGPSGAGKSSFVKSLILKDGIEPRPEKIYWLFAEDQPLYRDLENVEFIKGIPENFETFFDSSLRNLVIIDDMMTELQSDPRMTRLFTVGSSHRNCSFIYIVHNIFAKGTEMRNLSLNSHYLILFKNPRDSLQIATLARQMYPHRSQFLVEAYKDATKGPYSYLFLDLKPTTPENLRVRTNIFDTPIVYIHEDDSPNVETD